MRDQILFAQNNPLLFGHDETPFIVAAEQEREDRMEVFTRQDVGIRSDLVPFHPFVLLEDPTYLSGWNGRYERIPLEGDHFYKYLVLLPDWSECSKLVKFLTKATGHTAGSFDTPFFFLNDPVHQYLLLSVRTLFKGMLLHDLGRLQLDIETLCTEGFEFSNPQREGDRIIVISLSDSLGWERVISGKEYTEEEMLREMVEEITRRDPDVIEGHNIFNFDLPYIEARAKRYGVPLSLGRNGRPIKSHPSRMTIAERAISYTKYDIYGRHVVDTMILAQLYDVTTRDLESFSLKDVARHFHVSPPGRTYLNPERIGWYYENDPETLLKYALDDVKETRSISSLLSQSFFYQAQVFPYSYQNVILRGNATKIDSFFMREYVRRRYSIPKPPPGREFVGGYTAIFQEGVLHRVLHCDVRSLYPSLMLTFHYFPRGDYLGVFPSLLRDLRDFRIQAKEKKKQARSPEEAAYFDALQGTFKILINSFYGYLGFAYGHFADPDEAEKVTAKGRDLISGMVAWLQENHCQVIEIDTDGIYFVPPEEVQPGEGEEDLVMRLSKTLPPGITLELSGRYKAMFSYKVKNYVLLDYEGNLIIKGSGLRSRGLELFQRRFMGEMFSYVLRGKEEKVEALRDRYMEDLIHHRWEKKMFIKSETLQESLEVYEEKVRTKKRNPAAAYELAKKSGRRYQAGDQISYYVTGKDKNVRVFETCKLASQWDSSHPDENCEYYREKLLDLYEKFRVYWKPGSRPSSDPMLL